ncbi:MAG: nucleoside-diphosphate sugar epimerase/dehydratase [Caldilineaceae bacterium]
MAPIHIPDRYVQHVAANLLQFRNRHFLVIDLITFALTPSLALYLRTDMVTALGVAAPSLALYTVVALLLRLAVFYHFDLYRRFWRYASSIEMAQLIVAIFIALFLITISFVSARLSLPWFFLPRSLPIIDSLLVLLIAGGARAAIRVTEHLRMRWQPGQSRGVEKLVLLYGAGGTGAKIAQEIQNNGQLQLRLAAILDDDPHKWGMQIYGTPVVGGREALLPFAQRVPIDRVIITMPTASGAAIRAIVKLCHQAGIKTQILPGFGDLINGAVTINSLRNVQIEDLLRRAPIQTDTAAVTHLLQGKRVLVTGGGGSIGSELCRQILRCRPAQLILVGHGENSIFETINELRRLQADLAATPGRRATVITPVIADLRFPKRILGVCQEHQPEVIFHAAAHKHVPLMEINPVEAITNNVLGTQILLAAAREVGVERFVMISTDKAVNPTNVMGASKRVAEFLVLQAARQSGRFYQVVRFGNVLGSRGSVIHTFKQQIAAGGPVTVTHPEMIRYFMTIPEAVQLVLQAAVSGAGGEVLMLDMGDPVRIVDLARDLIALSGLQVESDIAIEFTGLRPGEKLYEEMFTANESYGPTQHEKVLVAHNASHFLPADLDTALTQLIEAAQSNDCTGVIWWLQHLLPEYRPWEQQNRLPTPDAPGGEKAKPTSPWR